jgi:hypothetical protein
VRSAAVWQLAEVIEIIAAVDGMARVSITTECLAGTSTFYPNKGARGKKLGRWFDLASAALVGALI